MATTVKSGGVTYTKPENAQAGWLAAAKKSTTSSSSGGASGGSSIATEPKAITSAQQSTALSALSGATTAQQQAYATAMKKAGYNTSFLSSLGTKATTVVTPTQTIKTKAGDPYYTDNKPQVDFGTLGGAKSSYKYEGPGAQLTTGDVIKGATGFTGIPKEAEKYNIFGQNAIKAEQTEPGFLKARNDLYVMDILKNNPNLSQEDADKTIIDYIKARDTQGTLNTATPEMISNTVQSIKNQMGKLPTAMEVSQKQMTDKATQLFDKELKNIDSQYEVERNNFLKAGAVEDRFTNFNEVNDRINNVLKVAGQHRIDNLYTGMPNDDQISEIATLSGQDFATTKKILERRGFEDLQMQGDYQEQAERPYQRQLQDFETEKNRAITDAETQHQRTITALNEQIDDTAKQMERNIAVGEKAGALSGGIRSTGYLAGLENIRNDALKNIQRLELRQNRDTADTAKLKGRITENYEKATTRTKQDLTDQMNQIKISAGTELNKYVNDFMPSSTELSRKLDEITDKYGIMSQKAYSDYMGNLRGITDTMTYDTEKVMELQKLKQDLQQTNIGNLLANNGAALAGINYNDLSGMLKSGDISSTDYVAMVGNMKSLGLSTLQSLGIPTSEDINLYNQLLEQGTSPQQAIATITAKNPSRYTSSKSSAGSDWKYDTNTEQWYRTNTTGQLEFSNTPTSTSQGLQFTDNTANMLYFDEATQKQDLVEYGKKNAGLVYEFGGDGSKSVDCSQLLVSRGQKAGVIPQGTDMNAQSIFNKANKSIPLDQLQSGDLIFYNDGTGIKHTGIALGPKQADGSLRILDASTTMGGVAERTIKLDANNRLLNDKKFTVLGTDNWMTPGKTKQGEAPQVATVEKDIESLIKTDKIYKQASDLLANNMTPPKDKNFNKMVSAMADIQASRTKDITDPNEQIIVKSQVYDKDMDATAIKEMSKAFVVVNQIEDLAKFMENNETDIGPIEGYLRNKNPRDTNAQTMNAMIQGMVANVSRGVFGEVGVLTDQDIDRYMKTIPNNTMPKDVSKIVSDLLKINVKKTIMNSIATQAKANRNVYGFKDDYVEARDYVKSKTVGSTPGSTTPGTSINNDPLGIR